MHIVSIIGITILIIMEVTFIQLYVLTNTCPSEIDNSGHEVTVIVRR